MPNCMISVPYWQSEGQELANTPTPVEFNMLKNGTLFFSIANTQTVYMYFNLVSIGTSTINYVITIYDSVTYNIVTNMIGNSAIISTNVDLQAGTYIVCLRSVSGSYSGTARADYFGFGRTTNFTPTVDVGEESEFSLTTDPRRQECSRPLMWALVDGKLPPGLSLEARSGLIYGRLPYIDCLEDADNPMSDIPSANLFLGSGHPDSYDSIEPWGRRWNFKLRIYAADQPQNFQEQWFCILIYNNWTRSTAQFLDNYDNGEEYGDTLKSDIQKDPLQRYQIGLCNLLVEGSLYEDLTSEAITDKIQNVIDDYIKDGQNPDGYNIKLIEFNQPDLKQDNLNPSSYTVYEKQGDDLIADKHVVENDGSIKLGAYGNHNSTIDMDIDFIAANNVFVPDAPQGHVSEDILIQLDSYDQYTNFRAIATQWLKSPISRIEEYRDNRLFNDFMRASNKVKYDYIYYDPKEGIPGVEDTKGITDEVVGYIYIEYKEVVLPEVEAIKRMAEEQQRKSPWEVFVDQGESIEFTLTQRW